MGAYSKKQFNESGFDISDYQVSKEEGTFIATLDCKLWGKKCNVLGYFTLTDGRKIFASAWQNSDYLGIPEIPVGAVVKLTFQKTYGGTPYLRGVEEISPDEKAEGEARLTV